ncbi:VOC family protein [Rhizobium oryziradicis]|uniref:VOC family protein n=1 Tax=Rhizobium oryziradicis TaxID=1867956 RepID=UPI000A3DF76C|nr:VOC family protein [Rhizobium oryziradicis]
MVQSNIRSVDHLVLPVSDLEIARARLQSLGFCVAANGRHPFGTENACIFLPDNTYLEPLAVVDAAEAEGAITNGNLFVARDKVFRQHRAEGLSAIVVQSEDAIADHAAFAAAGVGASGDILEFSRPVRLPDGQESISSFRLAFAIEPLVETFFLFACQRLNPLPVDRDALETHANGVLGVKRVLMQTGHKNYQELMTPVFGRASREITNGHAFDARNMSVEVVVGNDASIGIVVLALVFTVADLKVTEAVLAANGVCHVRTQDEIVVQAAPGQGVTFLFEENAL